MRAKDREFLKEEAGRRLESLLQRMSEVREIVPWLQLRPGQSYADLRRTAARLRSGAIRPADPRVSPHLLADLIEKAIAQDLLVKMLAKEAVEYGQMYGAVRERYEAERARRIVNDFHRLKKSPEASDPDSRAAERVRTIDRTRRNELGRPRRRRRD